MKYKILLTVCLLALFGYSFGSRDAENAVSEEKTVTVCCTPDVQAIAETFIREYSKSNDHLKLQVKQVAPDRFSEEVNRENSLGLISEKDPSRIGKEMTLVGPDRSRYRLFNRAISSSLAMRIESSASGHAKAFSRVVAFFLIFS